MRKTLNLRMTQGLKTIIFSTEIHWDKFGIKMPRLVIVNNDLWTQLVWMRNLENALLKTRSKLIYHVHQKCKDVLQRKNSFARFNPKYGRREKGKRFDRKILSGTDGGFTCRTEGSGKGSSSGQRRETTKRESHGSRQEIYSTEKASREKENFQACKTEATGGEEEDFWKWSAQVRSASRRANNTRRAG